MTDNLPQVPVEKVSSTKPDKKKSGNLAIKIFGGLLILVILSEVAYLVYNNFIKTNSQPISGPGINQEEISAPSPTPTPETIETTKNTSPSSANNINPQIVEYFNRLTKNPNISYKNASFSFTVEGEIKGFNNEITNYSETKFPLTIYLKHDNEILNFYFSQKEYISTKVTDQSNPNKKVNLLDLRPGDKILFTETTNLINGTKFNSKYFITIIE